MELVGTKVRLRPLTYGDLPKMALWNKDTEVQFLVDGNLPGELIELERWYLSNVPDRHYRIFAIEDLQGELIGDLELDHICWNTRQAELRIRIGEKAFWGLGYGSDALSTVVMYYMGEKNFQRIYLKVYHFNERAIRCYKKNGFRQIGILQRGVKDWKDIILMEINRTFYYKYYRTRLVG
jgi:RimJ/RimL family protein N-acetyltransferase